MNLGKIINEYITFKQAMGMKLRSQAAILKSFCQTLGDINITEVEPTCVLTFISGKGPVTTYWHEKFKVLEGFYRFALSRGYTASSPLPTTIPKRPESSPPYVYTTDELRRLIAATETLKTRKSPLQFATFRTLLLTLYGAGLRISEALSLTLADVNLSENLITVRNTKFFKSRLIPIGPNLTKVLANYESKRRQLPMREGEDSTLFITRTGNALPYERVNELFQILRKRAGIHREDGARYQPRIHDIRGTFAVHTLIAWYREGGNVQRLLPALATYLGHTEITGTQHYLSMITELQEEASRRFEQYALLEVANE